jgi:hypothetical protein
MQLHQEIGENPIRSYEHLNALETVVVVVNMLPYFRRTHNAKYPWTLPSPVNTPDAMS